MKRKGISLVVLIIFLGIIVGLESIYIINSKSNESYKKIEEKSNLDVGKSNEVKQENIENNYENFNDKLISYVLDLIKTYAENGYILKSPIADVTSEKLSRTEFLRKKEEYKIQIENLINDTNYFGQAYEFNNSKECVFNFEKILETLELSCYQGIGIGIYDSNGNKLYRFNDEKFETDIPTNLNIIEYFNKDSISLVDGIINKIKDDIENNILVNKENDNPISKEMLETEEYKNKIIDVLNDQEIFTEIIYQNGNLKVSYNYSEVLNNLNIKTNDGTDNIFLIYEF